MTDSSCLNCLLHSLSRLSDNEGKTSPVCLSCVLLNLVFCAVDKSDYLSLLEYCYNVTFIATVCYNAFL